MEDFDQILYSDFTILIAEDSKFFTHKLKNSLKQYLSSSEIYTVSQLEEIDEVLKTYQIDILVLDLIFPRGSSTDKISAIRRKYPDLFIIVSSGQQDIRTALNAMSAGADYYIVKDSNFDADLLVAMKNLNRHIKTKRKLETMINHIFNPNEYPMLVLKASETGVSEVFRDFDQFPERISDLNTFIQKIGLSLIVGIGQGDAYHTGIFKLPASESKFYNLLDFAFRLEDNKAKDKRLRLGYYHIVLFIPNSFESVFPKTIEIEGLLELIISQLETADDLTAENLSWIKQLIFDTLRDYARSHPIV